MRLTRSFVPLLALLFPLGVAAQQTPDTITFTNGDYLSGKLEKAEGGKVTFKSDMAGEISVPFDKVKALTSSGRFVEIAKRTGKHAETVDGTIAVAGGRVTVTPSSGAPVDVATKDVGYLVDESKYRKDVARQRSFFRGWEGQLMGGGTLVRSTQNGTTLTGKIDLTRTVPMEPYLEGHDRTEIEVKESYGKESTPAIPPTVPASPDVVVTNNIFEAEAEHDEYVSDRVFLLAETTFNHDTTLGLDLEQIYGLGAGWTAVKGSRQTLDLKADLHYERHSYLPPPGGGLASPAINLFGTTFGENYIRHLAKGIVFTEKAKVIPGWNDTHALSADAETELSLPVFKRLSASVSVVDHFLNDPAPFYRKNSFQFITGVTYNLK